MSAAELLILINIWAVGLALYLRQQRIINETGENAHAISDVWNYITKNPDMTIDDK